MPATIHRFSSPDALADILAGRILERAERAREAGKPFLLGCPTGRTPRPLFEEMARRIAAAPRDVSNVVLVMMDEYLVPSDGGLAWAPEDREWSGHHFAKHEIAGPLSETLPERWRVPAESIWFPDPADPEAYESRIADAGGIDLFVLASGASDGHVAFNPPGSPRDSRTRIIPLGEQTRQDNLQTFPSFGTLDAVPHHGVSVGVDTICRAKEAILVLTGAAKRLSFQRVRAAARYEPDWPATLIHECPRAEVVVDGAAAG
jgi:glucosamine-6-phosphate deaminase